MIYADIDFIFLCWLVFETIGRKLAAQSNDQQLKRFFLVVDGLCLVGGVICVFNHISGKFHFWLTKNRENYTIKKSEV